MVALGPTMPQYRRERRGRAREREIDREREREIATVHGYSVGRVRECTHADRHSEWSAPFVDDTDEPAEEPQDTMGPNLARADIAVPDTTHIRKTKLC